MKIRADWFVLIMVLSVLGSFCYAVLTTVQASVTEPTASPSWQSPEIPQCDKELWLRIKDGCNE